MFPSTTYSYSTGPYPCFPSSSSSYPLFPFLNPENNASSSSATTATNNNNNNLLHDPSLCVPYIPIPEALTNLATVVDNTSNLAASSSMPKQHDLNGGGGGGAHHHFGISSLLAKKPAAAKKDRHSKIYTAQGLRDRRVRLSIEIARKFFDLQDMLGFDKASNTLDWLFTKSKKAIKELARSKNHSASDEAEAGAGAGANNKSFASSSDCDEDDFEVLSRNNHHRHHQQGSDARERKLKSAQQKEASACNVRAKMKESREKARARARERTSNKMCNSIMGNSSSSSGKVLELKKRCPAPSENPHHLGGGEVSQTRDDFNVIEESIVIKRKLKQPSMMSSSHHHHHHHHQLNLPIPNNNNKEASFNNNSDNNYHPGNYTNLSPNWDNANGPASSANNRSNFCAIASMNLSTGLQIFGKSWEECTNPSRLH
ncbi:hypothetical protein HN51_060331 [Arachis hypogaea]|uniref:TCP domain-containing protein n=1 Tax=Arachis hypogaea TaxID=3818 RepID=A0A444X9D8_ARAHY|nr:transcription factor DICHOTOMA-like [Arachis ipaensis]XP_025682823.1 transcription factor DICHOTOMA-like [Arachis hypogaea]QHN83958.1 Transcription factor [Arachis hypogaea]RYQ86284.1 hypothetical protein Ahy_B10g105957 [Arachis hypogaea]